MSLRYPSGQRPVADANAEGEGVRPDVIIEKVLAILPDIAE